jgi:hypothetical protein
LIFLLNCLEKIPLLPFLLPDNLFLLAFIASKRPARCVASPLMWLDKEYETKKEYFKPLYQSSIAVHLWVHLRIGAYQNIHLLILVGSTRTGEQDQPLAAS